MRFTINRFANINVNVYYSMVQDCLSQLLDPLVLVCPCILGGEGDTGAYHRQMHYM